MKLFTEIYRWRINFGVRSRPLFVLSCLVAFSLSGCIVNADPVREQPSDKSSRGQNKVEIKNVTDLNKILTSGMTTNEIALRLGSPDWEQEEANGDLEWHYQLPPFPADDQMRGTYVVGVIMNLTNGCLRNWGCMYLDRVTNGTLIGKQSLSVSINEKHPAVMTFFLIHDRPVAGGKFIDSKQLPKLGYISSNPEFVIRQLKNVSLEGRKSAGPAGAATNWVFKCSLNEKDAAQFEKFTAVNISKRILIVVNDEPIVAPTILASIKNGSFDITCPDDSTIALLKKQLEDLKLHGP